MPAKSLACFACTLRTIVALVIGSAFSGAVASGATLWSWSYSAPGVAAGGTFTTNDVADASGGFLITGITGERNGIAITGLQASGTAIPGNEPFAVDDLVFRAPGQQLTVDGFGYALGDGTFANPFFADFLSPPGYLEFFSTPPFNDAGQGPGDSELPIEFAANPVPEPWPVTIVILGAIVFCAFFRNRPQNG